MNLKKIIKNFEKTWDNINLIKESQNFESIVS